MNDAVLPRKARGPGEPSDAERRQHGATHLPFRSWCRHCVLGRMSNPPHSGVAWGRQHAVPEIGMDYCFLTKDAGSATLTVLVMKDRDSRAILAHPVLCKGRGQEETIQQAVESISRLGHRAKLLLKTDNEPALVDLRRGIASALGLQVVEESPPAYEPQSNGSVENAVKQVKGLTRTLMLALQERIKGEILTTRPCSGSLSTRRNC